MRLRRSTCLGAVALGALLAPAPAMAYPPPCDPFLTAPVFRGEVPTPEAVLGFPLGDHDVTAAESDAYVAAVDFASPRVVSGTLAVSVQGRPLQYAIVGLPENVTPGGLRRVKERIAALRDPALPADQAAALAAESPAILWVAGNVHGGEESGTDASLRVLFELSDRSDCAAQQILENAVVVLLPTQNPDGREADTRRNAYGFDLNRDWFARTQPETDGKVEMLRGYPPQLFVDAHEMSRPTFFFPPNADPVYHEITEQSIDWINDTYGAALAAEFTRQGIPFFIRDVYDLFYMGYGNTVPSTGFIAAGMTFEKSSGDPTERRVYEQYVTQWTSLTQGAVNADAILANWHDEWVRAYEEGVAGQLEPNKKADPSSVILNEVPPITVRHYFVRADERGKGKEVRALIRRLQRMDVRVYKLTEPLDVPDFHPYARPAQAATLPAGTYWIPMAQTQKHWVQAMLNENTYVPFPYFYDVTAWSQPLLYNVAGGYSGAELAPVATLAGRQHAPVFRLPDAVPSVALFQMSADSAAIESSGWLRWLLEQRWHLPYRDVTAADIAAGGLTGVDVLLVPHGDEDGAQEELGAAGRDALAGWVNAGGRYVGWQGGTRLAVALGLSTVTLRSAHSDIPGSLIRARVDTSSPLAGVVGPFVWAFYQYDDVMKAADPDQVVVRFPQAASEDFYVSGFADGEEELSRTAVVVDEPVGAGRAIVSSVEPNFRAFTDGTQRLVWNAIFYGRAAAAERAAPAPAAALRRARAALARLDTAPRQLRLSVRPDAAGAAASLLDRFGARYSVRRSSTRVSFVIANPRELSAEQHPFARALGRELKEAGVAVIAYSVP